MATLVIGTDGSIITPAIIKETSSSGGSKYNIGDTVTADNGSTVGTVVGIFFDASKNKYAVVGLQSSTFASGLSMNNFSSTYFTNQRVWNNHTTATETCNEILGKGSSAAVSHCRQYSYVIDGVTYYGQLPNIYELVMFFSMAQWISGIPSSIKTLSCTAKQSGSNWYVDTDGSPYYGSGDSGDVMPILEIPF